MRRPAVILLLMLCAVTALGQTVEELRRQIEEAEREIQITTELLEKTSREQDNNRSQLRLVQNNINNREAIVRSLDSQISLVNRDVQSKTASVSRLENELKELKSEYSRMISASYRNYKLNNYMSFLFSARDFNDATRRIYYMKRYTAMRERKAEMIDSLSTSLRVEIKTLEEKRSDLDGTRRARDQEVKKLNDDKRNYQAIDTRLSSQTKKYNDDMAAQRARIENLEKEVARIIAEEARKAQSRTMTAAETEQFIKLTGEFADNKGKLPYPVGGGVITVRYGLHNDPDSPNVKRDAQQIKITAAKGADVRAVFDGTVAVVTEIGINYTVIIRHGEYMSVYANVEKLNIKPGDAVSTNQVIGQIYSGSDPSNYYLLFGIWKQQNAQAQHINPEPWLRR